VGKSKINGICYPKTPDVFQEDIQGQKLSELERERWRSPVGEAAIAIRRAAIFLKFPHRILERLHVAILGVGKMAMRPPRRRAV